MDTENVPGLEQVAGALIAGYEAVAARDMSMLPGYNPRLRIEAVGFRSWEGHGIGVLIAPWFINLVLLPGPRDDWSSIDPQDGCEWKLPAELILFHPCTLEGAHLHLTAPLFTDLTGFPDQALAREVAREVMIRLFEPADAAPDPGASALLARPVSRRGLFAMLAPAAREAAEDA